MGYDLAKFDPSDADEFVEIALTGLSLIDKYLGSAVVGPATTVLAILKAVLQAIQGAYDQKITCAEVREEFAALAASLEANDEAADAALAHKFDVSDAEDEKD